MALLIRKDLKELVNRSIERIHRIDGATTPGSNLRLLVAVINKIQQEFYEELQIAHLNAFVSSATNECLDLIGDLVHCSRMEDEPYSYYDHDEGDKKYRERIRQQVTALEDCNELAIRMSVLAINGIADMLIKKYTHGTGSYSIFIIPDDYSNLEDLINNVKQTLEKHEAYGIRHNVEAPDLLSVAIRIRIIFLRDTLEEEKEIICDKARQAIADYINSRSIGDSLIYNELISAVMNISDYIYDMDIYHYVIEGENALHVNQDCEWNEKFIESKEFDAIMVS